MDNTLESRAALGVDSILSMLQVVHQHRLIIMDTLNHVQKSRNHENDGFSGFPNNEIGKLLIQNEAE